MRTLHYLIELLPELLQASVGRASVPAAFNGARCAPYIFLFWFQNHDLKAETSCGQLLTLHFLLTGLLTHPELPKCPAKPQGPGGRFVEAGPEGLDPGLVVPAQVHPVGE